MLATAVDRVKETKNWINEKVSDAFEVVAEPSFSLAIGYVGASALSVGINIAMNGPSGLGQEMVMCFGLAFVCGAAAKSLHDNEVKGAEGLVAAGTIVGLVNPPSAFIV
jgi:hypothetical protein